MALKDWKKISISKNEYGKVINWKNKNNGDILEVNHYTEDGRYELKLYSNSGNLFLGRFETEKKSLSDAKDYMKKH